MFEGMLARCRGSKTRNSSKKGNCVRLYFLIMLSTFNLHLALCPEPSFSGMCLKRLKSALVLQNYAHQIILSGLV